MGLASPARISWAQDQLEKLRAANIDPIVGLLHHGSGPAFTNLYDERFAEKLADYASKVAEQFPWVKWFTPVNEPLTTARFSGLYGLWYPHHKNELSFVKMLLNQLKGTILSMQAIRKIIPGAKLIQTEDLAKIHSTPLLRYQASFENKRRWLTYDILCGRFGPKHFFWEYFLQIGVERKTLEFFTEQKCEPDIMGFNYYLTSERYIDENLENYPDFTHGGNGRHRYADTEAVRSMKSEGLEKLLQEAWKRYEIPLAITECHLSCTREEQLRWFYQSWKTACSLNKKNIPVKGVTLWSLFGAYDWNSLLTREDLHYEAGAFDLRGGQPRRTALFNMLCSLSKNSDYDHPLIHQQGWWNKNDKKKIFSKGKVTPLLIIGKTGTLGTAFTKICEQRSIPVVALSRQDVDIRNKEELKAVIGAHAPWAVINTAGYVRVDDAEQNRDECFQVNADAPAEMARICNQLGIRFMSFSSDLVFDGEKKDPYHEFDHVKPLNVYGESKAKGEQLVKDIYPGSLLVRTSAFFGPWDQYNFIYNVSRSLREGKHVDVADDIFISPTYVPDLVNTALDLFIDGEEGIWHITNNGILTWADLAIEVALRNGHDKKKIITRSSDQMGWQAKRPLFSVLKSGKGASMPTVDDALERYFKDCNL